MLLLAVSYRVYRVNAHTKFYEVVRSLSSVYVTAVLLAELVVQALEVAVGQSGGIGGLTQHQVADTILNYITGGKRFRAGLHRHDSQLWCM